MRRERNRPAHVVELLWKLRRQANTAPMVLWSLQMRHPMTTMEWLSYCRRSGDRSLREYTGRWHWALRPFVRIPLIVWDLRQGNPSPRFDDFVRKERKIMGEIDA